MNPNIYIFLKILACIITLFWVLFTFRPIAIATGIIFCLSLFFARSSRLGWPQIVFGVLTLVIPMQLYTMTLLNVEGGPRVVSCCPGAPYVREGWKRAMERQESGECKFCSDMSTGFNPRYFLVW